MCPHITLSYDIVTSVSSHQLEAILTQSQPWECATMRIHLTPDPLLQPLGWGLHVKGGV